MRTGADRFGRIELCAPLHGQTRNLCLVCYRLSNPRYWCDQRPGFTLNTMAGEGDTQRRARRKTAVRQPQVKNPYIRIALRRARAGTGSSPVFLNRRTAVQQLPNLPAILQGTRWTLIGAMALRAYAPERMTQDVDILIHADAEPATRSAFVAAGYRIGGTLSIGGFTAIPADEEGYSIDVVASDAPWLDEALDHPSFDPAGFPVLPRQFLVLMKLQAGRAQDVADITRLLRTADRDERALIRTIIARYAPDLVEDYDALVMLTDLEFGAPEASQADASPPADEATSHGERDGV